MRPENTAMAGGDNSTGFGPSEFAKHQEAFRRDLQAVLNKHSQENGSDTPDFMLAEYLIDCLRALDRTIGRRDEWKRPT